jgi:hypothetical protein
LTGDANAVLISIEDNRDWREEIVLSEQGKFPERSVYGLSKYESILWRGLRDSPGV